MKWKNIIPHPGTQLDAREAHKAKNHGPNWVLQEIEITNQKKNHHVTVLVTSFSLL